MAPDLADEQSPPTPSGARGSSPLRVLHVVECFAGGVFWMIHTLARYQRDAGHEVAIAYARRLNTPPDLEEAFGPRIELIELPWGRRRGPLSTARAALALRRVGGRLDPDVVHLHSSFAGVAGSLVLTARGKTIYTPHGYSLLRAHPNPVSRRIERGAERFIAHRADAVGAVSEQEAQLAREVGDARRVAVIPNGIPELDEGAMPGPGTRSERPLVVTIGRVTPQRRPAETAGILRAVADLATVEWVGDRIGEDTTTPLPDIQLTGWVEREEAMAKLADATVCLNWSAWDGSPLAVLEAMARDVIVVASDIPANRELLEPEQICADTDSAIALLRRILTDAGLRERLLAAQRRRRSRFSAERMAQGWEGLYRSLVESIPLQT